MAAAAGTVEPPAHQRELPEADIYEIENVGDDALNEGLTQLQNDLKLKLKSRKDIDGQCLAYNNLGTAYHRLFKFDKAELCHHYHLLLSKAVTTAMPFIDKRPENLKEKKCALANLGCVYHAKREYELALQTFKKALALCEEVLNLFKFSSFYIIYIHLYNFGALDTLDMVALYFNKIYHFGVCKRNNSSL